LPIDITNNTGLLGSLQNESRYLRIGLRMMEALGWGGEGVEAEGVSWYVFWNERVLMELVWRVHLSRSFWLKVMRAPHGSNLPPPPLLDHHPHSSCH
jgi:hypothetical protein